MTKVKDGFWKQLGSKVGSDDYLLKAAGGYIGVGNSAGEVVPINNGTLNSGLNADKLDGYHLSDLDNRYVTLTTAQTISGAKTFNSNKWILSGPEHDNILNKGDYIQLWKYDDSARLPNSGNGSSITNSISFNWYNDEWRIGQVRNGSSDTKGFAIALMNAADTHALDMFRIDANGKGYITGYEIFHTGNLTQQSIGGPFLPLAGGTMDAGSLIITATSSNNDIQSAAIRIREYNFAGNSNNNFSTHPENAPKIQFYWSGNNCVSLGSSGYEFYRIYQSNAIYKIWDSGNDGSGSGLDADKLDGYHLSDIYWATVKVGVSSDDTTTPIFGQNITIRTKGNALGPVINFDDYYNGNGNWVAKIGVDYYGNKYCTTTGWTHGMYFITGRSGGYDHFFFLKSDNTPLVKLSCNGNIFKTKISSDSTITGTSIINSTYNSSNKILMSDGSVLDKSTFSLSGHNHDDRYLRNYEQNYGSSINNTKNIAQDLTAGVARVHISNVEYSAVFTMYDFNGKSFQLKGYPSGTSNVYYRNQAAGIDWIKFMDSTNCSVSKSGETLTVKINDYTQSLTNTWRAITNTYTGSDQSTSVSQYGTNALYNALLNGYANEAGNADTVDNEHAVAFYHVKTEFGGRNYYKQSTGCSGQTKDRSINGYIASTSNTGHNTLRISNIGFNSWEGDWTVSFEIKADSAVSININLCDYQADISYNESSNISVTTSYVKHKFTFTNVVRYHNPSNYNGFLDLEFTGANKIYVKDIKIEKGVIATDWSLAPEDVAAGYGPYNTFTYVDNAYHLRINSVNSWSNWYWSGQSGQPTWLWGSNDGTNMYVWNPSNFSVNYANSAGNADTLDSYHASGLLTSASLGASGTSTTISVSVGGTTKTGSVTVPYANYSGYTTGTNTGNWDANNPGNYQYLWFYGQDGGVSNKPGDALYGSVINFFSNGVNASLNFQLYGSINHNSSNVSHGIWWRGKNNLSWDATWHRLYDDNYHPSADYATSSGNSDKLDNLDSSDFLRYCSTNYGSTINNANNIATNLTAGIHKIHISNVEYSSILTGYDFNGSYWQLYFHPTSGYSQDIRYRASNCTSWKTILDSNNSSVSKSGETLSVKINGTTQSLTNTWRGIQNNLNSDSTTDSLSAAQGKSLNGRLSTVEGDYLTRTTTQTVSGTKTFNDSKWVLASAEASEITNKADYIALYNANNTGYLWASYSKVPSSIRFRWYSDYWRIGHVRSSGTPTGGFVIALESGDHLVDRFRLSSDGTGYLNGNTIITSGNWSSYITTSSADDTVWQDNSNSTKYKIQVVPSLPSSTNSNTFYVIV